MNQAASKQQQISNVNELVAAAAVDSDFYARTFFPKTAKQRAPVFHGEMWDTLERPENRLVAIEAFRGSAKTSILRLFTSKRIAYGISNTILFISDTEGHAVKSVEWLMKAVKYNYYWAETFKLRQGGKWTGNELEIIHGVEEYPIRVIGLGVTGQVRGINVDDYRPDFIVLDDPENDENVLTHEGRNKLMGLVAGAILRSLAPSTENPSAMMAVLQTPLHRDDLIEALRHDPSWVSRRYSCFDDSGTSRWPERYPTDDLLQEKQSYIGRNQLSVWMREMECKVVSAETCAFRADWLMFWDILPDDCTYYMAIDPASSDAKTADFQAMVVVGIRPGGRDVYLAEYTNTRGEMPDELAQNFVRMWLHYRPLRVIVETRSYQKILKWYLETVKKRHGIPAYITEYPPKTGGRNGANRDTRSKGDRIRQALTERAASRQFWVNRSHTEFIGQFSDYPSVSHDDLLDAFAMAMTAIDPLLMGGTAGMPMSITKPLPDNWRSAP